MDLTIVVEQDPAAPGVAGDRVKRRRDRLRQALPFTGLLLDWPCVYEDSELGELAGSSALTFGLGRSNPPRDSPAGYFGDGASLDRVLMLERPGLYTATGDWHLLCGPDRRPRDPPAGPQLRRIAAWLELTFWWRQLFAVCADWTAARAADLCVKCIAEPARIWLWLAHGQRAAGRVDVLRRALELMPEEEDALRRTLELKRALPRSPDPPLAETLPALIRISARIAGLIDAESEAAGWTDVTLAGLGRGELVLPEGGWKPTGALPETDPELLPLTDWRALACPLAPDDSFALLGADPSEPAVLRAAARVRAGPYPTLCAEGLLIRPGAPYLRTRLRAIQCRTTDPVSFSLRNGGAVAAFPNLRGWSAIDTAWRAVAEQRAWLHTVEWGSADGSSPAGGRELGLLLTAARAALFLDSLTAGDPILALTVTETGHALAERSNSARSTAEEAVGCYREFGVSRAQPPRRSVSAMAKLVLELAPYSTG